MGDAWRSVDEVLASTSDVLFPGDMTPRRVTVDCRAVDGDTPLHVTAWRDDVQGAKLLLAAGADVNAQGDMGYTPLHVAVANGSVPMVTLLLEAGARTDVPAEITGTARDEAVRKGGPVAEVFANRTL